MVIIICLQVKSIFPRWLDFDYFFSQGHKERKANAFKLFIILFVPNFDPEREYIKKRAKNERLIKIVFLGIFFSFFKIKILESLNIKVKFNRMYSYEIN